MLDFSNSELVFDCEANGLLSEVTKIWCIYFIDVTTKKGYLFHDYPEFNNNVVEDEGKSYIIPKRSGSLKMGVKHLYKAKKIIAHNALGYDIFLLNKFYPQFNLDVVFPKVWDTLIQSKIQRFDRGGFSGRKGVHGLDPWGARLKKYKKPPVTDWTIIDAFKLHRCIIDVRINFDLYKYLGREADYLKNTFNIDYTQGMLVDSEYLFNATKQGLNGALIDVEHAGKCVKELDSFLDEIKEEVEPLIPPSTVKLGETVTWKDVGDLLGWKVGDYKLYSKYHRTEDDLFGSKVFTEDRIRVGKRKTYEIKTAIKPTTKFSKLNGQYTSHVCDYFNIEPNSFKSKNRLVAGAFSRVGFEKVSLSQHALVKKYLMDYCGWIPTEFNYKKDKNGFARDSEGKLIETSPKLTEDSFASISNAVGKKIANYNVYSHRRRFLENVEDDKKGILNKLDENNRIECSLNVFGTATGRSSQYNWVNAPGGKSLYGDNIRRCIIAPEGRILVGADMKSAQLSIAAYYAKNKSYLDALMEGQEYKLDSNGNEVMHPDTGKPWYLGESGHCTNNRAFGLVSDKEWKRAVESQDEVLLKTIGDRRSKSKGGSFATIFGATGKKVATTLGIPEEKGNKARSKFLKDIGLDNVLKILDKMTTKTKFRGGSYIELPFGYWVWCKSKHKYFNYLDQGTEAACQKVAVNYFEKQSKLRGLDCIKILDVHDEFLVESNEDCKDEVGRLMCESYKYASDECFKWHKEHSQWFKDLEFPFNLDGGYKLGKNYYDVH